MRALATLIPSRDGILRATLDVDFARYYLKLFHYAYRSQSKDMCTPRHGVHITVANPQFHRYDSRKIYKYNGRVIEFFFDPCTIYSSRPDCSHRGLYLGVTSPQIEAVRNEIGLIADPNSSLHITLFTNKNTLKQQYARKLPATS